MVIVQPCSLANAQCECSWVTTKNVDWFDSPADALMALGEDVRRHQVEDHDSRVRMISWKMGLCYNLTRTSKPYAPLLNFWRWRGASTATAIVSFVQAANFVGIDLNAPWRSAQ